MRKLFLGTACAAALAAAPLTAGTVDANAQSNFVKGLIGGAIAGVVIGSIVRAGQNHCHQGLGCHSHGYARAYHYHQSYGGPILYRQAVAPAPVAPAGYPPAHYSWCARYKTYDAGSNTYIQVAGGPRVLCRSPYGG